jgi:hypothetical protein
MKKFVNIQYVKLEWYPENYMYPSEVDRKLRIKVNVNGKEFERIEPFYDENDFISRFDYMFEGICRQFRQIILEKMEE